MGILGAMSGAPPDAIAERPAETSDAELFAAARAGSRDAAEAVVETTYRFVYASLYRLCGGDGELAADLTQETYRKAWAAAATFDGRARLTTWLYRIAYNTFLNDQRRLGNHPVRPFDDALISGLAATAPGPDQLMRTEEVAARLRRAVIDLPEPLRFVVTATFWGELSVREIAFEESITEVAVRKRMKRAMSSMRAALEGIQ